MSTYTHDDPAAALAGIVGVALGPAPVLSVAGSRVTVLLEGREVMATLAVGYPYCPSVGDSVLAIAKEDHAYVVGVIAGTGCSILRVPGDLVIEAGGRLSLRGGRAVEVDGQEVTLRARALKVFADCLTETLGSAFRSVAKLLRISAGQRQLDVESTNMERSQRTYMHSEKETIINAEQVNIA